MTTKITLTGILTSRKEEIFAESLVHQPNDQESTLNIDVTSLGYSTADESSSQGVSGLVRIDLNTINIPVKPGKAYNVTIEEIS